ncbi:MAG TPA: hypothetical protein VK504_11035, partial [Vicinamibacterales bacterium]|nr:hypothetical protein [Vicinamibacterales bacterium]
MTYNIDFIQTGPADAMYETDMVGTLSITTATKAITGVGTKFTQLSKGDIILCESEEITIDTVTSDTAATALANAAATHTTKPFTALINLGLTNGGIERATQTSVYESQTDQLGTVKETIEDRKVTYKLVLAQWSADALVIAIPESLPLLKGTAGNFLKRTSPSIGLDLSTLGRRLRIIPVTGGVQTTDKTKIVEVWKASPSAETNTLNWGKGKDRTIEVMLRGWPDTTRNNEIDSI